MNKGQKFWLERWQTGQISFHQTEVNEDLISYWSQLNLKPSSTVLVPLCGKSLDMLWLVTQGFEVIGIELAELAVLQFFDEHQLAFEVEEHGSFKKYVSHKIQIWVADLFAIEKSMIGLVDAIYDRGALIALPIALRPAYVSQCCSWLKPKGKIFLKAMEYNQEVMDGPPFSVDAAEIQSLYCACEAIEKIKEVNRVYFADDHLFGRGLREAKDILWFIKN